MAIDYSRPRRDYRAPAPAEGGNDTPRAPRAEAPTPAPSSEKGEFVPITGLFPSKSGKADTAFIKPGSGIIEKLHDIREGDTIGVSMNQKTHRLMLWFIAKS